jgi:hypothetical protein
MILVGGQNFPKVYEKQYVGNITPHETGRKRRDAARQYILGYEW